MSYQGSLGGGRVLGGVLLLLLLCSLSRAQEPTVMLITVSGTIDLGLAPYISRALHEAEKRKVAAVILRINTPGGRVDAAIQMRDALLDTNLDTIAFIDKEAYSAGALIALAAQRIYMTGGAVIGAAAPVSRSGQPLPEKYVSAIRKLFRATAERNGRPPGVAEAMVDEDVAIAGLIGKGKLLTLTTQEALQWKVADGQVDTLEALLKQLHFSPSSLIRVHLNWAESLVRILTLPTVSALLLMVGLLALVAEVLAPGFGVGGIIGVLSLAIFFGSHYLVGLAGWEEALLIVAGIVLLGGEVLLIPGFGVAGVLGLLSLGAGLFLSFLGSYPTGADVLRTSIIMLTAVVIIAIGTGVLLVFLPCTPFWARLSLNTRLDKPTAGPPLSKPLPAASLLGVSGITVTPLLPSGAGLFQGQRLDIIAQGEYIPIHTPVRIICVEGNRLVVRPKSSLQPDRDDIYKKE